MPAIPPYDQRHIRNIIKAAKQIKGIYLDAINEISFSVSSIKFKGEVFNVKDYPILKKKIEALVAKMQPKIHTTVINSIENSWDISNQKNNLLVDKRLAGRNPKSKVKQILYDPNEKALAAFKNRTVKGLNLSDRVWKGLDPFKSQLEAGLSLGISEGRPAAEMAKDLKKYLNEPDKLFRRVRDKKGNLVLSKPAREYSPGQGVARSSYKNALRLTRTETNHSYRMADHNRWQKLSFVIGYETKLSAEHDIYDICDELTGEVYPKDFVFTGYHPNCLCYAVPVMMDDEQYDKYEDSILNGTDKDFQAENIKEMPKAFDDYLQKNRETIEGYKNLPMWISENPTYTDKYFK